MKHSQKTVIVISADLVCDTWYDNGELPLLTDTEIRAMQKKLILVILQVIIYCPYTVTNYRSYFGDRTLKN